MRAIDRINDALGLLAALLLFLAGVSLTYEVSARYLFRAPTTWAQELSELLLVWGVFLALGRLIHRRQNIAIDMLYERLREKGQRALDALSLVFVLGFLALATWYGGVIALDSFSGGITTATILDVPKWWAEAAIPVGCGLAALQCLVEIVRAISGRGWIAQVGHGHEP